MLKKLTRQEAEKLSGPTLTKFNPYVIPMQGEVVDLLRGQWDYKLGTPEVLLSGSYGSSKSILLAHLAVTHCLEWKYARVCICRRALPDLKRTIFQEILEHIQEDMVEGVDYTVNTTSASIKFLKTGSEIISMTWADKRYKKGRSLRLSMLIIEELTENDEDDFEAFKTLKARLRRLPAVKENILICATNPDDPNTVWYEYFIKSQPHKNRFVFYSVTEDNPFLDPVYIQQLYEDLDALSVERYLKGRWVSVKGKGIYHQYDEAIHFRKNETYKFDKTLPIDISWDFNIGDGKPLSVMLGQYDPKTETFHTAITVALESIGTSVMLDELASREIFELEHKFRIYGDATGEARTTKSIHSDYDIIKKFLQNYVTKKDTKLSFEMKVPRSNPPVRTRHNKVNAYLKNGNGKHRLVIYKEAALMDQGLRLTTLKKGGEYIEDDSAKHPYQHVTTALGYWIVHIDNSKSLVKGSSGAR